MTPIFRLMELVATEKFFEKCGNYTDEKYWSFVKVQCEVHVGFSKEQHMAISIHCDEINLFRMFYEDLKTLFPEKNTKIDKKIWQH